MKKLKSYELRQMWLDFFKGKGHTVINSSSLIPENDPTVLFTTAGMHPLVPYLLGQKHPGGSRLANVQKCVRTGDIDEVGDATHCTFFEMLGNWSLGDYFKEDMIKWSWEFLTSEKYLGIPKDKIAVSVFEGDADAPRDEESASVWQKCGVPKDRIFYLPKKNNWWGPAGLTGPCGPDTEMFIDNGKAACGKDCSPACDCGKYVEVWNDVFMQYNKNADGGFSPLKQKNVDTGMGLERTVCMTAGVKSVYETDLFERTIARIEELSQKKYKDYLKEFRIVADHIRTSVFMIGDERGITPSNVDQGYVLRRLIRRAVRYGKNLNLKPGDMALIAESVIETYKDIYREIGANAEKIIAQLKLEEERFEKTLAQGIKEFEKAAGRAQNGMIDGVSAFHLYDTYGFPVEMTVEFAAEKGIKVDVAGFDEAFKAHQALSQAGADQRFKGGLADASEETAALHTATHLMHAALKKVLGESVAQKGSNITAERLRFDFSFERKVEPHELKEVERLVNEAIAAKAEITCRETTVEQAMSENAIGLFGHKYGDMVKVYTMGAFSKEICGGPHAANTGDLGKFLIQKEESSSAGVRRIKAVLIK